MSAMQELDQATPAARAARIQSFAIALYAATLFLSALLIFAIQPMFTKMVLPKLGGSPSVWSVAMVVFQVALFVGYVYAHLLARILKPAWAALLHLAFLALVTLTLPFGIAKGFGIAPEHGITFWLIGLFFASIGLPFVALAASAPLLQSWFTSTGHRQAANPYVLYASSNLGSFAALLAYPILIEPLFPLQSQIAMWSTGFYALVVLIAGSAIFAVRPRSTSARPDIDPAAERSSVLQYVSWMTLAAIPSALVIAVTAFISTDVAAAPFLWVLPLALYLLTFVAVFRERPWIDHATVLRLVPFGVAPLAFSAFGGDRRLWLPIITVNLFIFMALALACHGEAYRTRPHHGRLTEFYLSISFGGAIGGLFAGLIAPNVFNSTYEYPLLLALALLLLPTMFAGGWRRFIGEGSIGLTAGTILAILGVIYDLRALLGNDTPRPLFAALLVIPTILMAVFSRRLVPFFGLFVAALLVTRLWVPAEGQILSVRSFFGVHSVAESEDHRYHLLYHGTTIHGAMRIRDDAGNPTTSRPEPLTYFFFGSPISDGIEAARAARGGKLTEVAILGLGAGSLACHRSDGESWTFFEIDPEVVRIARDPKLFRFLSSCAPDAKIVVGDARLTLAASPATYDLIVLDVFSSDAIPAHLLTREAFAGYLSHLSMNGLIVVNASNRHMDLVSVLGAVGEKEGLVSYVKYDRRPLDGYRNNSIVVALARKIADFGDLPARGGWKPVINAAAAPWTDDYANLVGAIIREKFSGPLGMEPTITGGR